MGDNLKTVILHHSLTKDSGTKSFDAIKRYHMETHGWNDIGYQYVIEEINGSYVTFKGRSENSIGAHTEGHNTGTIGICLVGNFDITTPSTGQMNELYKLLDDIEERYKGIIVMGHCEYSSKSCPGKLFPLQEVKQKYNYTNNSLKCNIFNRSITLTDFKKLDGKNYVGIRELFTKLGYTVEYTNGVVIVK